MWFDDRATARIVEVARPRVRVRDEFVGRARRQPGVHPQRLDRSVQVDTGAKSANASNGGRPPRGHEDVRRQGRDEQRVAVGRRAHRDLRADEAARAGAVLDHDRHAQFARERFGDGACDPVRRTARRLRDDDADRSRGPGGRGLRGDRAGPPAAATPSSATTRLRICDVMGDDPVTSRCRRSFARRVDVEVFPVEAERRRPVAAHPRMEERVGSCRPERHRRVGLGEFRHRARGALRSGPGGAQERLVGGVVRGQPEARAVGVRRRVAPQRRQDRRAGRVERAVAEIEHRQLSGEALLEQVGEGRGVDGMWMPIASMLLSHSVSASRDHESGSELWTRTNGLPSGVSR